MLEVGIAAVIGISLTIYALTGGADFGGGVWDLLARGPLAARQRAAIVRAIGPIWEANHVWMILVIVLLFACFPRAFAVISTALHVPIALMLVGIVLRGSAFVFRAYDDPGARAQRRWGRIFAVASTVTPITLGVVAGTVASGAIRVEPATGRVLTGFIDPWLRPFPLAIGAFTLALFAFLAAVYLCIEITDDEALRESFRRRALGAAAVVGALALACFLLSEEGAPSIRLGLAGAAWSLPFQLATGAAAVLAILALWTRRYALARVAAAGQVTLILWGWFLAQHPYVVVPDLTIAATAAPPEVLGAVMAALGAGAVLLVPSLYYLFRVFKAS